MKSIFFRLLKSESPLDDLWALLIGFSFYKSKFFKSTRVQFKNQGKMLIIGRFFMGTFSNRNGLTPNSRGILRIYNQGNLTIRGNVRIARDCKIYVAGNLQIGNGTFINPNSLILAHRSISIGAGCAISWNCEILDSDLHTIIKDGVDQEKSKPIIIEDNVWIGTSVKILKGVTIGKGSVIAAGTVVTKDVEPNCLYGGNPARKISERVEWKN